MNILQEALEQAIEAVVSALSVDQRAKLDGDPNLFGAVLAAAMKDLFPTILDDVKKYAPLGLAHDRSLKADFAARVREIWGRALDLYHICVSVGGELVNSAVAASESGVACHEPGQRLEVLKALHSRACQVAGEIEVLLSQGFADGAHARWRSLYEISIIAELMAANGDELAVRYVDHATVERWRAMRIYQKHCERLGHPPYSDEEMQAAAQAVEELKRRYGAGFVERTAWAADREPHESLRVPGRGARCSGPGSASHRSQRAALHRRLPRGARLARGRCRWVSATNIARLTNEWEAEYRASQKRSLADRDYVYVWVDGVHFNVRLEDKRRRPSARAA
jgi:hypothetical protein